MKHTSPDADRRNTGIVPGVTASMGSLDSRSGRTSVVLDASQIEYLERLCARFRREIGARFSKAILIRILVGVLVEASIPLGEVRSETQLKEFLHAATSVLADGERGPIRAVRV
jgi:hypothetical protein